MIGAVVLAAGRARRMGRPKQLLESGGRSLLRIAVDAACGAGCAPVIVVLGAEGARVRAALDGLAADAVVNPVWSSGLASSIGCGIAALASRRPEVDAVLLMGCDQPRVSAAVLRALCAAWVSSAEPASTMVASGYAGTVGSPAVFPRGAFDRLRALTGDQGAKRLLLERPDRVLQVAWPDGAWDVDEPVDRRLLDDGL